jgi:hypothetical protein
MIRSITMVVLIASALGATACGDRSQTSATPSTDTEPYATGGVPSFRAEGWTPGDKTSWEKALRNRTEHGQNEYTRTR